MKKYPFIQQLDNKDCGAACSAMIIQKTKNFSLSLGECASLICTTENGSNFLDIKKGLEKIGIYGEVYRCDESEFNKLQYPIITQVKGDANHFIVIYKVKKRKLLVADPLKEHVQWMTIDRLKKNWIPYVFSVTTINKNSQIIKPEKEYRGNIKFIFHETKFLFIVSWILSLCTYGCGLIYTTMYPIFFDNIVPNRLTDMIPYFTLFFIIFSVIQIVINLINMKISVKLNNRLDYKFMQKLIASFFKKDFQVINQYKVGELITRFRNVTQIRNYYIYLLQVLPLDIIIVCVSFMLLMNQQKSLTLLLLIPILIFSAIIYLSHDIMKKNSIDLYKNDEEFNSTLIEVIDNVELIKNYNISNKYEMITSEKLGNLLKVSEKFISFDILQKNIKNTIFSVFTIVLFGLGSYLIIQKTLSQGMLLVFHSMALIIFNPIQKIGEAQTTLEQGNTAKNKYEDIVNPVNGK